MTVNMRTRYINTPASDAAQQIRDAIKSDRDCMAALIAFVWTLEESDQFNRKFRDLLDRIHTMLTMYQVNNTTDEDMDSLFYNALKDTDSTWILYQFVERFNLIRKDVW